MCLWLVCASVQVCVRARAAPTLCPLMLCGERSIIFYDLFNLASRRELLQPSQPCVPRHNTHIKDEKQANKQTITLTNGSALPLTSRQSKTNPMRYANEEVMAARRSVPGEARRGEARPSSMAQVGELPPGHTCYLGFMGEGS